MKTVDGQVYTLYTSVTNFTGSMIMNHMVLQKIDSTNYMSLREDGRIEPCWYQGGYWLGRGGI